MTVNDDPVFSIILPVYNQAEHIAVIVAEHVKGLRRLDKPFEVLLVVNGPCRDDSLAVCQGLAGQYPEVRVIHSVPGGWGLAVRLGLKEARGQMLCYTNSARTTTEELVLLNMYALAYPNVVVKANRKIRESLVRRAGSLLYNLQCRALFDLAYWDINGTPKVFPRQFAGLLNLSRDDDLIDLEFNVICKRAGLSVIEVPVFSSRRHGGRSTTTWRSAWRLYGGAFALWRGQAGKR